MSIYDIPDPGIPAPRSYEEFINFKLIVNEPMKSNHEMEAINIKEYINQYKKMFQIGSVVSVMDIEHPEYLDELFLVVGFQVDIYSFNDHVAIMNCKGRVFLVNIDKLILKDMFTIDDVIPSELTDILWVRKRYEI